MNESLQHRPVLPREVVELLQPARANVVVDCTVGLGGHFEALARSAPPEAKLIAIDADAGNLRRAKQRVEPLAPGRCRWFHANFAAIEEVLAEAGESAADCLLADLGVASSQLADPGRGMSFAADGPLDMRLDVESDRATAAELVNRLSEVELADLIFRNADERRSRAIARAIVQARRRAPVVTTGELAEIVSRAVGGRRGQKIHPATRTFQALRIAVNDEMGSLDALLAALPRVMAPGGRAVVISFHSLEDRRVKHAFSSMKSARIARIITPKPIVPDDEEIQANSRGRGAKLRCMERV